MAKIVIALGGNALGNNPSEQQELVALAVQSIVPLMKEGHSVIVTHGNGPQIGSIYDAMEGAALARHNMNDMFPLAECGALSQGYIGYHLVNALEKECQKQGISGKAVALVTRTVVKKDDLAFNNPTKPIGRFYSKEEAEKISIEKKYHMKEDSGRGYRRVVASPKPVDFLELAAIDKLNHDGFIVVCGGGGGIPVFKEGNTVIGVDAVIDKDWASSKLASLLDFDRFIVLTAVEQAYVNFGKPNQEGLKQVSVATMQKYVEEGQFAPGSMLPKIQAALDFVMNAGTNKKRVAIITSLEKAADAIAGKAGTHIQA